MTFLSWNSAPLWVPTVLASRSSWGLWCFLPSCHPVVPSVFACLLLNIIAFSKFYTSWVFVLFNAHHQNLLYLFVLRWWLTFLPSLGLNSWRAEIFFLVFLLLICCCCCCYIHAFIHSFVLRRPHCVAQASLRLQSFGLLPSVDCRCEPACSASFDTSCNFRSKNFSSVSKWGNWHKETTLCLERQRIKAESNTGSELRILGLKLAFVFCGFPLLHQNFHHSVYTVLWPLIYIIFTTKHPLIWFGPYSCTLRASLALWVFII